MPSHLLYEDTGTTYEQATFTYEGGGTGSGPFITCKARIFPPRLLCRARVAKREGYPNPLPNGLPGPWGGITDTRLYVKASIHKPAASIYGLSAQASIIPGAFHFSNSFMSRARIASHKTLTCRANIKGQASSVLSVMFNASGDYSTSLRCTFVSAGIAQFQTLGMVARIVPSGSARLAVTFDGVSSARTRSTVRTFDWTSVQGGQNSFTAKARIVNG
jgi:hypothetical protein